MKFRQCVQTDTQTDRHDKAFSHFSQLDASNKEPFLSTFSQTQNVSITQLGNLVALNQAHSKQRNKILANCFESCIMETELNREIQVVYRRKATVYCNCTEF